MSFEIEVNAGSSVKLPTAGKYCDRDIVVTATGGDGGYDEGYADGVAKVEESNASILTDCNAVLPDKGVEPADTLEQVPQRIGEIDAEGGALWKAVHSLEYTFANHAFPTDTELVVNVPNLSKGINYMIYNATGIKSLKLKGNTENHTIDIAYPFISSGLEELDLTEFGAGGMKFGTCKGLAYNCTKLRSILGELDFSEVTGNIDIPFNNVSALVEVRIKRGTLYKTISFPNSPLLSADSIQSIIDGLADLTGQTAQTLTFHKTVGNKLTEAQKATITAKNWTLVY